MIQMILTKRILICEVAVWNKEIIVEDKCGILQRIPISPSGMYLSIPIYFLINRIYCGLSMEMKGLLEMLLERFSDICWKDVEDM